MGIGKISGKKIPLKREITPEESISTTINGYDFDGEDDLYGFNSTLNKITMIPHSDTVIAAWMKTEVAIKS